MTDLNLDIIHNAVIGTAAAFRCVTEYQPVGGLGDKVFPPTYAGGKYATEQRVDPKTGELINCVLLDSVQSQANRIELALLDASRDKRITLPVVSVRFDPHEIHAFFEDKGNTAMGLIVTSLDAPHRVADAILRDSLLEGVSFRRSSKGRVLDTVHVRNATGLFGLNPTALVLGLWDSTGPRGGLGAKFQRALVSEIIGYGAQPGISTESRLDPLGIARSAGPVFRTKDGEWTTDEQLAQQVNGKPALYGLSKKKLVGYDAKKDQDQGAPSKINHGNIVPDFAFAKDQNGNNAYDEVTLETGRTVKYPRIKGGFTLSYAKRTTVISLPTLRRLRFPLDGNPDSAPEVDQAARTVLTTLGILGATLSLEAGADLRSRCHLVAQAQPVWELLDSPGEPPKTFTLTGAQAVELFSTAVSKARQMGLPWENDEVALTPSDDLLRLVARSQEQAMHQAEAGE